MNIPITEATDGTPDNLRAMLKDPKHNPMQIELRGYEVARETEFGWQQAGKFTATEIGRRSAVREAQWLQDRYPHSVYTVRPIVSLNPPQPKEPETAEDEVTL